MQRPIIFANGNVKLAKAPTKHEYARDMARDVTGAVPCAA